MGLLEKLVEEDFGFDTNGGRWGSAEEHDSLVVDREKDLFYWNSADIHGDAYTYLTKVRGWDFATAKEYLKANKFVTSFVVNLTQDAEVVTYPPLVDMFHEALKNSPEIMDYFYRRSLTFETMQRFKLGKYKDFATVPIYQDGLFWQLQLRKDRPEKVIRNYYRGVGPRLFNSDILKFTETVYFTEGLVSSIALLQNHLPAVSCNTGATGFMEEWFPYFIHQKTIYLLYDNDSAGEEGVKRTARMLGESRCRLYTFSDFEKKGYDANDFFIDGGTAEQLKALLNDKSKYLCELGGSNETKSNSRRRVSLRN